MRAECDTPPHDAALLEATTIILLSHNRLDDIESNLPKYLDIVREYGAELIVVDNASTDGSREYLERVVGTYQYLKVILNSENLGVAGGRNSASEFASRKYRLMIDDDTIISKSDIVKMLEYIDSNREIGALSPKIVHAKTGSDQNNHGSQVLHVSNFHGACHLLRSEACKKVGQIDHLCSFGGEELDLSIRLRSEGYQVVFYPYSTAYHNSIIRPGIEGLRRRRLRVFNFTRLHFKHFSKATASKFALRYFVSQAISAIRERKVIWVLYFVSDFISGVRKGLHHSKPVSKEVQNFYNRIDIRPDFGNIPLIHKIRR